MCVCVCVHKINQSKHLKQDPKKLIEADPESHQAISTNSFALCDFDVEIDNDGYRSGNQVFIFFLFFFIFCFLFTSL